MRKLSSWLAASILCFCMVAQALALNPDERLDDPALETRARALSAELRCLVCQNQSIDDSDAQLARDLRLLVREQLIAGKTDQEILDYLVQRYGEFVLLRPPLGTHTIVLWAFPALVFLVGMGSLFLFFKRGRTRNDQVSDLSEEERQILSRIHHKDNT